MKNLSRYNKAIFAFLVLVLGGIGTALGVNPEDAGVSVEQSELVSIIIETIVGTFAVYQVPNQEG